MEKKPSKRFITKQKENLEADKIKITRQIETLKVSDPFADPEHAYDNAAVDTDVREQVGHETIEAEIKDLEKRLKDINTAILKISKNRYGYCERCDRPIPLARLELVPEARYCMDCEKKLRK